MDWAEEAAAAMVGSEKAVAGWALAVAGLGSEGAVPAAGEGSGSEEEGPAGTPRRREAAVAEAAGSGSAAAGSGSAAEAAGWARAGEG